MILGSCCRARDPARGGGSVGRDDATPCHFKTEEHGMRFLGTPTAGGTGHALSAIEVWKSGH